MNNAPKINLPFSRKSKAMGSQKAIRSPGKVVLSGSSPGTTGGHMWPNMPEGACMVPVMIPESAVPQQGTVKNVELLEARVDYLEAALLRAEANILDLRGNPISPEQLQEIENRASAALQKLKAAQQKSK